MKAIQQRIVAIRANPLIRNSAWSFAGQGLALLSQAAYFVVIARLLGSNEYGILVGGAASVAVLSQFGALGSGLVFLRHVSSDHTCFREYWGNIILSCLCLGTVLVLLLRLSAPVFLPTVDPRVVLLLAIADCIFGQLATATSQVFQAFEQMRYTAMLNTSMSCVRLCLAVMMLFTLHHASALQWASASCAVSAATAIAGVSIVLKKFGSPVFRFRLFSQRLYEGLIFAVSSSTTSIYNDVDKAMLAHYGLSVANGVYTMAYRVVDIGTMPIRSVHAAAFPRFFRHGASSEGISATQHFARKLLKRTVLLGLAAAIAMFVLAPLIPRFIGKGFAPSVQALRWLCLIPVFRSLHLSAGDALAGAGKQTWRLTFQALAAGGNFILNLYLIPHFSWKGAAVASLATDAFLGGTLWCLVLWMTHRRRTASAIAGPSSAALLAGAS